MFGLPEATRFTVSQAFYEMPTNEGRYLRSVLAAFEQTSFADSFHACQQSLLGIASSDEGSDSAGLNGDRSNDRAPGAGAVFLYPR